MTDLASRRGRSGLGRGLGALLGDVARDQEDATGVGEGRSAVRMLPVGAIAPHPGQPRRHFDETALEELAASIAERGIIQPIIVRPNGQDFQIVAGERRWRAAQRARLHEVPVVVRDYSDTETLQIALVENIQRQDLNAIEEAEAYQRLVDEFGHTQEALSKVVHKSRSHVANLMRLLDLPAEVQNQVIKGELSMGHARAILGADDPVDLAGQVVAKGLSVRQIEQLARGRKPRDLRHQRASTVPTHHGDADIASLERQLADVLGLKVTIAFDPAHGGGTLSVAYSSLDQLDMLCQRLTGGSI